MQKPRVGHIFHKWNILRENVTSAVSTNEVKNELDDQ